MKEFIINNSPVVCFVKGVGRGGLPRKRFFDRCLI